MRAEKICDGIYYTGVQNPDLRVFDVVMRTQWGTSYNSYLVRGSRKTAVIDCVKESYAEEHIDHICDIADPAAIDYIICNHAEPDHSGSLVRLLDMAPHAAVVCSGAAADFIPRIIGRAVNCITVKSGDQIDLGGKTLCFISAPYLRWPDSIFTYAREDGVLFSGDVFGMHFSAENIFDDAPLTQEQLAAQKYYYDAVMAPFGAYMREALARIEDLPITAVCPSHGPVLRRDPAEVIARYRVWSAPADAAAKRKVYIAYVSCYGYTRALAEAVFEGAVKAGAEAEIDDLGEISAKSAAAKIMAADAFAIGSPTLNRDIMPPVWRVLAGLCAYATPGKRAAVFGSYGWSGEAVPYMAARLNALGAAVEERLAVRLCPQEEDIAAARAVGARLAAAIKEE